MRDCPKNYVEPRTLENKFKTIAKQWGIENVQFHTLRHPYVKQKLKILSVYFSCIFGAKVLDFPLNFESVVGIYAHLFDKHIGKCLC